MPEAPAHRAPHPDLGGYVLGNLTPEEELELIQHLCVCAACHEEADELQDLPGLAAIASPRVELPPDLRDRTFAVIEQGARQRARRRRLRRFAPVAALVAVVLGLGGTIAGRGDRGAGPIAFTLTAPGAASGPRGTATTREAGANWVVELDIVGLPPSVEGEYYDCVYIGREDRPDRPQRVVAGSFRVAADGRASVRMTTAAAPGRYPAMVVTRERADGDMRPTGPVVLTSQPA